MPLPSSTRLTLSPHAATPVAAAAVTVTMALAADGGLHLDYRLAVPALRVPAPAAPQRCDGLWRRTCCELFVGLGSEAYREFNFSPSGDWAVYDFAGYREPAPLPQPAGPAPRIEVAHEGAALLLGVRLDAAWLPPALSTLGLSAVCEDAAGALSYWALRHPLARPDFHHRDARLPWPCR